MNSAIGYSEGAEVPEDKTPRNMNKDKIFVLYIQGVRMQERHKAIGDCIHVLETHPGDMNLIPLLESLKNKSI